MLSNSVSNDDLSISCALAAKQRVVAHLSEVPMSFPTRHQFCRLSLSPYVVDSQLYRHFALLHDALVRAISSLCRQWTKSSVLQKALPLPRRLARLLHLAPSDYSPHLGLLSFDLVFDHEASVKVSGVQAAPSPIFSVVANSLCSAGLHAETMSSQSLFAGLSLTALSSAMTLSSDLAAYFTSQASSGPVFVIATSQRPQDIALLSATFGTSFRHCPPHRLAISPNDKGLFFIEKDDSLTMIRSCILNLEIQEYMKLSDEILDALAVLSFSGASLSDLSTVFLGAHPALLHILSSDAVDLDEGTCNLLRSHIIPTIPAASVSSNFVYNSPLGLLATPHDVLRKEDPVLIQREGPCLTEMLTKITGMQRDTPQVLQRVIKQRKLEILDADGNLCFFKTMVSLISADACFYGPGLMRSSDVGGFTSHVDAIVLSVGARRIFDIPASVRTFGPSLKDIDTSAVLKSLREDGLALVGVSSRLGDHSEISAFLRKGLGARCRTHSDVEGEVWDVRPSANWNKSDARSHTPLPFETHTDASFELEPPRFVAMGIVRADRNGGGLLSIVRISDAVLEMSEKEVDTLMTMKPKWIVPQEFRKTGNEDVYAPVLMSPTRARFRRDKVTVDHLDQVQANQFKAVFEKFCTVVETMCKNKGMVIPEQSVILLDNQKFAHARSQVLDGKRHLLRVRFDLPNVSQD